MVGTSKILTVSYGTFSCTLEGFDDSFGTMKAIAEYFRGLAADDRYFGAEPPTPDAEMLAKIAEREISRRVDARLEDSGIVLRAAALSDQSQADQTADDVDSDAAGDVDAEAKAEAEKAAKAARKAERQERKAKEKAEREAAKKAEEDEAKARAEAEAERKAEEEAAEAQRKAEEERARAEAEEAKAQAEREAAEEKARAEAEAEEAARREAEEKEKAQAEADDAKSRAEAEEAARLAAEEKPEEEAAKSEAAAEPDRANAPAESVHDDQSDRDQSEDDLSDDERADADLKAADSGKDAAFEGVTETAEDQGESNEDVTTTPVPSHPDTNSVAAKLQRIRAVVGSSGTNTDTAEQIPADTQAPDVADIMAEAAKEGDDIDDVISRVMSRPAEPEGATAEEISDNTNEEQDAAEAPRRPRVIRMKRADFEEAKRNAAQKNKPEAVIPAPTPAPTTPDLGLLDGADDLSDYLEDSDFDDADAPGIDLDDDLAQDLRAIREEETAPTAQDEIGEVESDPDEEADGDSALTSSIAQALASSQDAAKPEDDPAAGLENDEHEVVDHEAADGGELDEETTADDAPEDQASDDAEPVSGVAAQADVHDVPDVDDAALDRLMSETDAQMNQPENSRRRDAIAQLKAAVAAKEAARQVGEDDDNDQDVENAFRNDLSEVVRPDGGGPIRPVVRGKARTERPRPAPLKLVAAQRVDLPSSEPRETPVVPRRVTAKRPEVSPATANSFADFAQKTGATDLPDLLEAAAAYTSFVEGADEFSRPQLLRRVRAVASEDFNREDGLRSFAELLKSGRFTKVRNGRFQIAEDTKFKPDQMAG